MCSTYSAEYMFAVFSVITITPPAIQKDSPVSGICIARKHNYSVVLYFHQHWEQSD